MDSSGMVDERLRDLEQADNPLFASVNTVRMPRRQKGRMMLVGDSTWCLTLCFGIGATMAIIGGHELGEALAARATVLGQH